MIQLAGVNLTSTTEALYDNQPIAMNNATGAFAAASVLTLLAFVTLILKAILERKAFDRRS